MNAIAANQLVPATRPLKQRIVIENEELSRQQRRVALLTLVVPTVGAAAAVLWTVYRGLHASTLWVAFALYLMSLIGLTVGFHRLFTHKSFKATRALQAVLAIWGMMAAQGPLIFWVAAHRRHHAYSDDHGDCHSPWVAGEAKLSRLRGLWHAHFGWMLSGEVTNVPLFARDMVQNDLLVALNRRYLFWVALGLLMPAAAGAVAVGGATGALEGLLWGGFMRIFFVHQVTWALNSLNHVIGARRYACRDNSRNIALLALLTMGEGWHNNHHAYPSSARFGHRVWELDLGFATIWLLKIAGLCSDVRLPNQDTLDGKEIAQDRAIV